LNKSRHETLRASRRAGHTTGGRNYLSERQKATRERSAATAGIAVALSDGESTSR